MRSTPSYDASLVERLYEAVVVPGEYPRLGRRVPEIETTWYGNGSWSVTGPSTN